MFGPNWANPVLLARRWSMGLIELGIITQGASFVAIAKAAAERINATRVVADLADVWIGNSVSCETASTSEVQRSFH
jgi:hypothetical protein